MGILTHAWKPVAASLIVTQLSGCIKPEEGAAIGAGLGRIIADEAGIDRTSGTLIGGALGRAAASTQIVCDGSTSITRTARRDNRTGAIVYDTTRQTQDQRCTGGRTSGQRPASIQPIF